MLYVQFLNLFFKPLAGFPSGREHVSFSVLKHCLSSVNFLQLTPRILVLWRYYEIPAIIINPDCSWSNNLSTYRTRQIIFYPIWTITIFLRKLMACIIVSLNHLDLPKKECKQWLVSIYESQSFWDVEISFYIIQLSKYQFSSHRFAIGFPSQCC